MGKKHRRWTSEQKRAYVLEHAATPYGLRGAFAREAGVDSAVLAKWRRQLAAGTLEEDLDPRGEGSWVVEDNKEVARMAGEVKDLQAKIARLEEEKASQTRVIDALGKAIELLRDGRAGKGSKG